MIFVNRGDAPLSPGQLERKAQRVISNAFAPQEREKSIRLGDDRFNSFMTGFSADHEVNIANNEFNAKLDAFKKAEARLDQYALAEGRPEVYEDQPTGEFDEEGNELMAPVLVQTTIEPLEPTVEETTYDEDGNASTQTVKNPLIVKDEAEREAAQAVIDATPDEVKEF
jgi:hypothetical protein